MEQDDDLPQDGQSPVPELAPRPDWAIHPWLMLAGVCAFVTLSATTLGFQFAAAKQDRVPPALAQQLSDDLRNFRARPLPLSDHDAGRIEEIAVSLDIGKEDLRRLIASHRKRDQVFGQIRLWDSFDQDGDVVVVTAGGIAQTVPILKQPTVVTFPYEPDGMVEITALRDGGGGGVTVAVEFATGALPLPPLSAGQTIQIPMIR